MRIQFDKHKKKKSACRTFQDLTILNQIIANHIIQ